MLGRLIRSRARTAGPGVTARLATSADYQAFEKSLAGAEARAQLSERGHRALADIERSGFCAIEGFWSPEKCAEARAEVDRVIAQYPDYVHPSAKADKRVYGANNGSALIGSFAEDAELLGVANAYNREPTICAFTLGARMPASPDNKGSGEGWHRDAFLRQFKAIIYLSDVGPENGPFQLIKDSQLRKRVLSDMKQAKLKYMQYRLEDSSVDKIVDREPERLVTFTAKAGTVLLVDTSTIHRGMPITAGTRYALTNYYFPRDRVDDSMREKFSVLPAA